ncbi:jg25222 [Pararge aegeria aegeria]|uniref:Jg25222 protein n=2 Tax=Pararge aegeria aegeria TaxID=348720 RepID=A0A8S4RX87_9NEOP|nr:jg25222 [Pararge aegeria aegeria]
MDPKRGCLLGISLIRRFKITERAMERAMLGVSLRDQNQSNQCSSASRKAVVEMGGAHSSENRWTLGFQGAGMATPHR